jgi:hypothetical protein
MDSLLSFPVGLFHPLQHAGCSGAHRITAYTDKYRQRFSLFCNRSVESSRLFLEDDRWPCASLTRVLRASKKVCPSRLLFVGWSHIAQS